MRILGLDLGSKTIGVAVSDLMGWTAQGVTTIERKSLSEDLKALGKICQEYAVEKIILGLPLNMNASEGPQAEKARLFSEHIKSAFPNLPLQFWDERLSTSAAERSLLEADLSREKRKKVINKMAAVFILQGYLDSQSKPAEDPEFLETRDS